MTNIQEIISIINNLAPQKLAYDWDNVGLQIGDFQQKTKNVLLSLDFNKDVLNEAREKNCKLIITHHPFIFNDLKTIHTQTEKGKLIFESIKNNISVFSAHTNLDVANNGLNDYLADILNLNNIEILKIEDEKPYFKLVFFVPEKYFEQVREAVLAEGVGHIGSYSKTSFSTDGEGTFLPGEDSDPHIGMKGKFTKVNEFRVETIIKSSQVNSVINKLKEKHPYEEVAYDLYPLEQYKEKIGLGRIGELKHQSNLKKYLFLVKNKLGLPGIKYAGKDPSSTTIKKIAVCSGSGADLIGTAKYAHADLYITGDIKYHEAQYAENIGLNLLDAGHYWTEKIVVKLLKDYLEKESKNNNLDVQYYISEVNTNPWQYIN